MSARRKQDNNLDKRKFFPCQMTGCSFEAYRYTQLDSHMCQYHTCQYCAKNILSKAVHKPHCQMWGFGRAGHIGPTNLQVDLSFFKESSRSHKGILLFYEYSPIREICMLSDLYSIVIEPLRKLLKQVVEYFVTGIRASFRVLVNLFNTGTDEIKTGVHLGSPWSIITHIQFIAPQIINQFSYLIEVLNAFNEYGSSWTVQRIVRFDVHVSLFSPEGTGGRSYIPLPLSLKGRNGLLNIKSSSSKCFEDCLLAHLNYEEICEKLRQQRADKRKVDISKIPEVQKKALASPKIYDSFRGRFNFEGISMVGAKGVHLSELSLFESNNPDISISVYKNDGSKIYPVRTPSVEKTNHVNLLLLEQGANAHYILIDNYNSLMGKMTSNAHVFCVHCQKAYRSQLTLSRHVCGLVDEPVRQVPTRDTFTFERLDMTVRGPYVLYYSIQYNNTVVSDPGPSKDYGSEKIFEREPIAYSLVVVNFEGKICKSLQSQRHDSNIIHEFMIKVLEIADEYIEKMKSTNNWVTPTPDVLKIHNAKTNCDFCKLEFSDSNPRHFDHCHETGHYRNTLCPTCNKRRYTARSLPAVSLSTTKYDFHTILKGLETDDNDLIKAIEKIRPLSRTSGEMIGLEINDRLRFIDGHNFKHDASLVQLREELIEATNGAVPLYWKRYESENPKALTLLLSSPLLFPQYGNLQALNEGLNMNGFVSPQNFDRTSALAEVSSEDYENSLALFNAWGCVNMCDYLTRLTEAITLLIASIFEFFRQVEMTEFGLDPMGTWTDSGYSWQCAWKWSGATVEYVKDKQMAEMVERGLMGGLLNITQRIQKSNSPRYGPYVPTQDTVEIIYADITGSYSHAMQQFLPQGEYEFLSREELDSFDFANPLLDSGTGYIFECSLHLPASRHSDYEDLPLCPEKRKVTLEFVSGFQNEYFRTHPVISKQERLLLTLLDKEKAIFYYKFLAFLLQNGYELKSVTRGFKFQESKLFAEYVGHNIKKRATATSKFMRDSYKSKNNTLSGRTCKDDTKYDELTFCFNSVDAKRLASSHRFSDVERISDDLTMFRLKKMTGIDRNFRVIGMVILSLGKLNFLQKWLDLKKVFGQRIKAIYTHTDSILARVIDNEHRFIKDLQILAPIFNFSNLPPSHELYSTANVGVAGVWKLEKLNIVEFLGVKPTQYSLLVDEAAGGVEKSEMKCSGVPKHVVQQQLRHENYRQVIMNQADGEKVDIESVRAIDHDIFIVKIKRMGLNGIDIKRYVIDNYNSLPFGSYKIPPYPEDSK